MIAIGNSSTFFMFNQALGIFVNVTVNSVYNPDLYSLGRYKGFPYQETLNFVNSTYELCNATLSQLPSPWPSAEQINAMSSTLGWGEFYPKFSLELAFDPKYANTTFVQCFTDAFTAWQHEDSLFRGLTIGLPVGILLLVTVSCYAYHHVKAARLRQIEEAPLLAGPNGVFHHRGDDENADARIPMDQNNQVPIAT